MEYYTWSSDINLGDIFLNFPIELNLRQYVEIALRDDQDNDIVLQSERKTMGLCTSPHDACMMFAIVVDVI